MLGFHMTHNDGIIKVGNILYGSYKSGFAYNVVGAGGVCITITTIRGGYREPMTRIVYER